MKAFRVLAVLFGVLTFLLGSGLILLSIEVLREGPGGFNFLYRLAIPTALLGLCLVLGAAVFFYFLHGIKSALGS
jgi:hypothetical protein